MPVSFAKSQLSLPGNVLDGFKEILLALLDEKRDSGGEAVGLGGFDEGSANVGVAGLGDAAETAMIAA